MSPTAARVRTLDADGARRTNCGGGSTAKCASTTAAARSTPPTARITARCRSAWSSRGRARRDRNRGGLPRVRRAGALAAAAGRAWPGQCCNVAVVMDFSKYMHGVLEIDPGRKLGARPARRACSTICASAAEKHGLTFGPDPATHRWCTLGGMLRQQLVRRAFADGRAAPPTTSTSSRSCSTTGRGCAFGKTSDDGAEVDHPRRRAAGEIYAS